MLKIASVNVTFMDIRQNRSAVECIKDAPVLIAKPIDGKIVISHQNAGKDDKGVTIPKSTFTKAFTVIGKAAGGWHVFRNQAPMTALKMTHDFVVDEDEKRMGKAGDYVVRSHDGTNCVVDKAEFESRFTVVSKPAFEKTADSPSPM